MSTTLRGLISPPPAAPRRRPVTRAEYERLIDLGFFGPDERLELIEGEIIEKMTQNAPHATAIRRLETALRPIFSEDFDLRTQLPLALGERSMPEPDLAVVAGSFEDYEDAHPTTAVLVIEISDSTLVQDRTIKAGLYASAGISEFWLMNVAERLLEVFRDPAPLAGQPSGHHYRQVLRLGEDDAVSPLAAPGAVIPVAQLLPRRRATA
jgi:Uma2 family endonuclease